jgi:hypothetical protein
VSFTAVTLYVACQRVFIVVVVYFVIDSVRKLFDTPSRARVCVCVCARARARVYRGSVIMYLEQKTMLKYCFDLPKFFLALSPYSD